jgi:hypothetical protein
MAGLSSKPSWSIEGDYSFIPPRYGSILLRQKEYKCSDGLSFALLCYSSGTVIRFYFNSKQECKNVSKELLKCGVFGEIDLPEDRMVIRQIEDTQIACKSLSVLLSLYESVGDVIDDVCKTLGLDISLGMDVMQLLQMDVCDAHEHVIKAQNIGNYLLIFQLIEHYFDMMCGGETSVTSQELCDLIDLVVPESEYYSCSHDIKFKMLLWQDEQHMTSKEKHQTKQELFKTSLKKGD